MESIRGLGTEITMQAKAIQNNSHAVEMMVTPLTSMVFHQLSTIFTLNTFKDFILQVPLFNIPFGLIFKYNTLGRISISFNRTALLLFNSGDRNNSIKKNKIAVEV